MELSLEALATLDVKLAQTLAGLKTPADLDAFRREWLSKEGVIKSLLRSLKELPAELKPVVAAKLNGLKTHVEEFVEKRTQEFAAAERLAHLQSEFYDLSLPGCCPGLGQVHPLTGVERRIAEILRPFGFRCVQGPEVETEYFCFDALNIPPHHPARDMQDTFYTETGHVMRTHTTSVQSRVLAKGELPVKVASFGRVYRNETEDPSHQAMFHQFELVWVEEGLTLAHLLGLINHILKAIYGKRRKVRFVPKFYPYTEPSIGAQLDCSLCKSQGCPACGGAGWVTIAGAGMVHRKVLQEFKYDPEKVTGFAFGLGTSRLTAQLAGMPTLKAVYENDLRVFKRDS